jgi:hypothetical protein
MAEIEYSGIKFSGSKLLLLVPLLGAIGGVLWGGFEAYARWTAMETKISSYTAPDLSGIEQTLAVFEEQNSAIESLVEQTKESLVDVRASLNELKLDIRSDVADVFKSLDKQDSRNRESVDTVRTLLSSFENRMDAKMTKLDAAIDTLEADVDKQIRDALLNPLSKK